jgi:hypothetical protein
MVFVAEKMRAYNTRAASAAQTLLFQVAYFVCITILHWFDVLRNSALITRPAALTAILYRWSDTVLTKTATMAL